MSFSKRLFISLLALTSFSAFAAKPEKLTAPCKGQLDGAPKPSIESLSKVTEKLETPRELIDLDTRMEGFCRTFLQTTPNALPGAVKDLRTDEIREIYFSQVKCELENNLSYRDRVPLVQIIADDPCFETENQRGIKLNTFYPKLWRKSINIKNTRGQTYLDLVYLIHIKNKSRPADEKACAKELIEFACETGGEFSIFKNETKCPGT